MKTLKDLNPPLTFIELEMCHKAIITFSNGGHPYPDIDRPDITLGFTCLFVAELLQKAIKMPLVPDQEKTICIQVLSHIQRNNKLWQQQYQKS